MKTHLAGVNHVLKYSAQHKFTYINSYCLMERTRRMGVSLERVKKPLVCYNYYAVHYAVHATAIQLWAE